jgi:hypothetical protein
MRDFFGLQVLKCLLEVQLSRPIIAALRKSAVDLEDVCDHSLLGHCLVGADIVIYEGGAQPYLDFFVLVDADHAVGDAYWLELAVDSAETLQGVLKEAVDVIIGELPNVAQPEPDVLNKDPGVVVRENVGLVEVAEALEVQHLYNEGTLARYAVLKTQLLVLRVQL